MCQTHQGARAYRNILAERSQLRWQCRSPRCRTLLPVRPLACFPISWQPLGLILPCAANLSLGTLVILHDHKGAERIAFSLSVLVIVGWAGSAAFHWPYLAGQPFPHRLFGAIWALHFATVMPLALLWLFLRFQDARAIHEEIKEVSRLRRLSALYLFASSLSPGILAGATPIRHRPNFIYGATTPTSGRLSARVLFLRPLHPLVDHSVKRQAFESCNSAISSLRRAARWSRRFSGQICLSRSFGKLPTTAYSGLTSPSSSFPSRRTQSYDIG